MSSIVIFDVDKDENEVQTRLKEKGYYTNWVAENKFTKKVHYFLPKRTLWKPRVTTEEALQDIQNIIEELNGASPSPNIKLLRCVSFPASPYTGIPGESI